MKNQNIPTKARFGSIAFTALLALTVWLALPLSAPGASVPRDANTALVGLWELTVQGNATYHYKVAISEGTWVSIGDVDGNFYGTRYSPAMGAFVRVHDGMYQYRMRGWTYDSGSGEVTGSFEDTGTFVLDRSGNRFNGSDVFTQFDLAGHIIYTENGTFVATRVGI